jgi:hypothetical protein
MIPKLDDAINTRPTTPQTKPAFDPEAICPVCAKPAVAMVLGHPNWEWVAWCENTHVSIGLLGSRAKVVFTFRDVEPE